MVRWAMAILTALSLLLFVGCLLLLLDTEWGSPDPKTRSGYWRVYNARGVLFCLKIEIKSSPRYDHASWEEFTYKNFCWMTPAPWQGLGFGFARDQTYSYIHIGGKRGPVTFAYIYTYASVPLWALLLLTSVAPARWMFTQRRNRAKLLRAKRGFCFRCGYDLRATPERCPECGLVVEKAQGT